MITRCLLLSLLFIFHGCGARNQTETTLKISNSFSITSQGYTGGLIIHGKNLSTGEKFTQSLKEGVQFTTTLNKGEWLLSAIGWPSTKKFDGIPHCGKVNTKLSNEQETVYISMNTTNCGDHFFSKGKVDSGNLKKINFIGTCDTFFEKIPVATEIISSVIVKPITPKNYCNDQITPVDLKSKIVSIKIFGLNKKPHELNYSFGFESYCINRDTDSTSTFSPSDLRLPLNEIPIAIKTYNGINCEKLSAEFIFKDGLDQGDITQFDHLLLEDLSTSTNAAGTTTPATQSKNLKLILPSNDLKRGLSIFSFLAPSFKKLSNENTTLYETAPADNITYDYRIPSDQEKIILEEEKDCDKIQTTYRDKCSVSDAGKVTIDIGTTTDSSTRQNPFTITGSKDYNIIIELPGFDKMRSEAQGLIMKLIGHNADKKTARFFNVWDDNSHYGYLSKIRNMFHPNGAGGVLGIKNQDETFEEACKKIVEDREIRLFDYEDKKDKWYRVVVSNIEDNSKKTPSNFICNLTNLKPEDCQSGIKFQKEMTIFNQSLSKENPMMRLKFSCTHPIGQFENLSFHDDIYNLDNYHQRIINWNTSAENSSNYQRFEIITWSKHTNSENEIFEEKTMARVFKTSTSDLEGLSYERNEKDDNTEFTKSTFFKLESTTNDKNKLTFKTDQDNNSPYSFFLNSNYPQAQETIQNTTIYFKLPNHYGDFNDSIEFSSEKLGEEDFKSQFKLNPASH